MIISLNTPQKFKQSILDLLSSANKGDEFVANYFVIREDVHGTLFLAHLAWAAMKGASVTLIVDSYGSLHQGDDGAEYQTPPLRRSVLAYLRHLGVKVYIFHDIESTKKFSLKNLFYWRNFSRRNHNKNFLFNLRRFNKKGMILGDAQWTDPHFDDRFRGNNVYVEDERIYKEATSYVQCLLSSKHLKRVAQSNAGIDDAHFILRQLQGISEKNYKEWDWYRPQFRIYPEKIKFVFSDIDFEDSLKRHTIQNYEIELIRNARHDIWYATPYFCPDRELQAEFIRLQKREHTNFQILIAKFRHDPYIPYGTRLAAERLIRKKIKIFEYDGPGNFHYKDLIVDDISFIKTANGDGRSRFFNLETGLIIQDTRYAEINKLNILSDIHQSKQVLCTRNFLLAEKSWASRVLKIGLCPLYYHHL